VTRYLLDVNVLVALIDPAHVQHDRAHDWFAAKGERRGYVSAHGKRRATGRRPCALSKLTWNARGCPGLLLSCWLWAGMSSGPMTSHSLIAGASTQAPA